MFKFGGKVVFKCTMAELIILYILFVHGYQVKAVSYRYVQGQEATLIFPYSCDSTEVTLQHSYRFPFYRSTDGPSLSLSQDQVQRFKVQNRNITDNCSLDLTINNLLSIDQGTYILIAYKDGEILEEMHRIWLEVVYPPGKASCAVSYDKGGDWVSIDCTANVEGVSGKIECYQVGVQMPSITYPTESDTLLKQTILVRKSQPVFCCSSTLDEYIERCECKDTALYLDDAVSSDPCPTISTQTSTTSTYRISDLVEKSYSSDYPLPSHTASTNANKMTESFLIEVIIYYIGATGVIISFIWTTISLYLYTQERKNNSNDESPNLKAIIIYYISATGMVILIILFTISLHQSMQERKNNSNDESQNLRAIFMSSVFVSGMVILYIVNVISLCHMYQPLQERKQNSNGESQDPALSRNVHFHYAHKCEKDKLNQIMMQELETHKAQNIA